MSSSTPQSGATKWVYITAGDRAEAERLARALVSERLAACVNILGDIQSFYWWDGDVQNDPEIALIVKTQSARVEALVERVKALHSYDCPCVVALDIAAGNPNFIDWIVEETS